MKVLFLDVDGVLNGYPYVSSRSLDPSILERLTSSTFDVPRDEGRLLYKGVMINPECVARVDRLVREVDCQVVLSSTWRIFWSAKDFTTFLRAFGATFEILDVTPEFHTQRGHEIQDWLDRHPDVDSFCILDDGVDMAHLLPYLVQTSLRRNGVTDDEIQQAIHLFESQV